jgi:hypothetical protein
MPGPTPPLDAADSFGAKLAALTGEILRRQGDYVETALALEGLGEQVLLLAVAIALLSSFYGLFLGASAGMRQSLASAVKTPLLFLLSLAICLPFLHVINALAGAQLAFLQTAALILFAVTLNCVILASFAPIAGFFSFSGSGYHFMRVMHVAIFAFSGAWSMMALRSGLAELNRTQPDLLPAQGLGILNAWMVVYGFVGMQMAWALRPFLGAPGMPFEFLRERVEGRNFYTAVWESIREISTPLSVPAPEKPVEPAAPEPPSLQEDPERPPVVELTETELKEAIVAALRREPPAPKREAAMAQAAWEALSKKKSRPAAPDAAANSEEAASVPPPLPEESLKPLPVKPPKEKTRS